MYIQRIYIHYININLVYYCIYSLFLNIFQFYFVKIFDEINFCFSHFTLLELNVKNSFVKLI